MSSLVPKAKKQLETITPDQISWFETIWFQILKWDILGLCKRMNFVRSEQVLLTQAERHLVDAFI